jgi:hypothetical protein
MKSKKQRRNQVTEGYDDSNEFYEKLENIKKVLSREQTWFTYIFKGSHRLHCGEYI